MASASPRNLKFSIPFFLRVIATQMTTMPTMMTTMVATTGTRTLRSNHFGHHSGSQETRVSMTVGGNVAVNNTMAWWLLSARPHGAGVDGKSINSSLKLKNAFTAYLRKTTTMFLRLCSFMMDFSVLCSRFYFTLTKSHHLTWASVDHSFAVMRSEA